MTKVEIAVPLYGDLEGRTWRITEPFLKLALKYGMAGPWLHKPWAYVNPSVAFDAYSVRRGPAKGLPDLGDFTSTLMMGSRVGGDNVARFLRWVGLPETVAGLEAIRQALMCSEGLNDLTGEALRLLGDFTDQAIQDRERLKGISLARVFKWLSAWAPAHVPMIDRQVHNALTGYDPETRLHESGVLLQRFRAIVADHVEALKELGRLFPAYWPEHFPAPIPPVRVLDNLIWFDWQLATYRELHKYVLPNDDGDHHEVKTLGRRFLEKYGF